MRYVKRNALAGPDDELQSWDDYKYLAIDWRDNIPNNRVHDRLGQKPVERFESEKPSLRPLPRVGYNSDEIVLTEVRSTAQIEFDCNRYSVPPKLVRRTVTVVANAESIRILHEGIYSWKPFFSPCSYEKLNQRLSLDQQSKAIVMPRSRLSKT